MVKMTFVLNVDTAPSLLIPNDTSNGFTLITVATSAVRTYRITREKRGALVELDYYDFQLDLTANPRGTMVSTSIPYLGSRFATYTSPNPIVWSSPDPGPSSPSYTRSVFQGEIFKLLCLDVSDTDPTRETPAYIDFKATYSIAGMTNGIQFVYYTMINGEPIYTGYFGNVSYSGQYNSSISIDPTRIVNVVTIGNIDHYVIRVNSTPNTVITNGIPSIRTLSDSYSLNGIGYKLTAPSNGIVGKSFYAFLTIPDGLDQAILDSGFNVEPRAKIQSYTHTQIDGTSFQFLITPIRGITSLDLKITFNGPI